MGLQKSDMTEQLKQQQLSQSSKPRVRTSSSHTSFLFNNFVRWFLLLFLPMLSSALWSLFHGLLTLDSDCSSCFSRDQSSTWLTEMSSLNDTSEVVTPLIKILTQLSTAYRITFKLLHMAHMSLALLSLWHCSSKPFPFPILIFASSLKEVYIL